MSKKPRYASSSTASIQNANANKPSPTVNPSFENYGYGGSGPPQLPPSTPHITQHNHNQHNLAALYTSHSHTGMNAMTTPNSAQAGATTAAPPSPYVSSPAMSLAGYNGMGMIGGMGMAGMGMSGMGMNNMGMGMGGMGMGMHNMGGMNMAAMGGMNMSGMGGMNMFNGMNGMGGFGYSPQMATFQQAASTVGGANGVSQGAAGVQGQVQAGNAGSPAISNFGMVQSHYSPAVAAAAAAANNVTGRTVYVGSLPPSASVDELLNLVHFGPLESIRVLPSKSCVFLSFLDGATAAAFHADATLRKLTLHGQELKIGWGKASPVPTNVLMAITQSGASRNVYIGGLDEGTTEERLRDELSRFGLIDQVKIVRDKNIGFVHFLSIATATKVVGTLPQEPAWAGKRVNYGKDRCAYVPKREQAAASAAQVAAAQSLVAAQGGYPNPAISLPGVGDVNGAQGTNGLLAAAAAAAQSGMNRTIYLGNIHPDTTTEDICNAVRGGVLHSIRYMPDKHIAFITFIDASSAFSFFQSTTFHGLTINNRRVKVGWGKNSGGLPTNIALAVAGGATRNVYIGNIREEEWEEFGEDRLRRDFGEFGEIELVNFFKEKNCAFVNFTNIANAIKAIECIKLKPEYTNLRVSHGKDRCANPPRMPAVGGSGGKRNSAGGGQNAHNSSGGVISASGTSVAGAIPGATEDATPEDPNDVDPLGYPDAESETPHGSDALEANVNVTGLQPLVEEEEEHIQESGILEEEEAFVPSEYDNKEFGKLVQEQD